MAHRTLGDYKFGGEVEDVRGSRVLGKDREALGVIDDVIFDESTAAVRYAIVDAGNWLESRKFVVPAPRLLAQPEAEGFVIQLSRKQIEKLPPFNEDIIGSEQAWKQYERAYHEAAGWSEDRAAHSIAPLFCARRWAHRRKSPSNRPRQKFAGAGRYFKN